MKYFVILVMFFTLSAAHANARDGRKHSTYKASEGEALRKIGTLLEELRQSLVGGVKSTDRASNELNRRLDELSQEVKHAVKTIEHSTSTSDEQVRRELRNNIQGFTNYVQSLSDKVFHDVHDTARELSDEAQDIQ